MPALSQGLMSTFPVAPILRLLSISTVLLNVKIAFRSIVLIGLKGNIVQYTYAFVISRILIR